MFIYTILLESELLLISIIIIIVVVVVIVIVIVIAFIIMIIITGSSYSVIVWVSVVLKRTVVGEKGVATIVTWNIHVLFSKLLIIHQV